MNYYATANQEHSVLNLRSLAKIAILIPVGVVNVLLLSAINHS